MVSTPGSRNPHHWSVGTTCFNTGRSLYRFVCRSGSRCNITFGFRRKHFIICVFAYYTIRSQVICFLKIHYRLFCSWTEVPICGRSQISKSNEARLNLCDGLSCVSLFNQIKCCLFLLWRYLCIPDCIICFFVNDSGSLSYMPVAADIPSVLHVIFHLRTGSHTVRVHTRLWNELFCLPILSLVNVIGTDNILTSKNLTLHFLSLLTLIHFPDACYYK